MAGIRGPAPLAASALRAAILLVAITALAACSDRGDTPDGTTGPSTGATPIRPRSAAPSGLMEFWMGLNNTGGTYPPGPPSGAGLRYGVLMRAGQVSSRATCLVAETGELACTLEDRAAYSTVYLGPYESRVGVLVAAAHGTLRVVDQNGIGGSGKLYAAPGSVLADGVSTVADFTITGGSLSDENRVLELTISSLGEVTTLSLDAFDRYYYGDSWLPGLSAVYPIFSVFGDPASMSIAADGSLFSQTASGCVIGGRIAIIDPRINLYDVAVTASGCATLSGEYEGLATVAEIPPDNAITRLKLAVFNGTSFIAGDILGW